MSGSWSFMNMGWASLHMQHDPRLNIFLLHMASPVSGQDEPIPTLIRAYPLSPTRNIYPTGHIRNTLLTKLVWSRRLNIGSVLFLHVYGP